MGLGVSVGGELGGNEDRMVWIEVNFHFLALSTLLLVSKLYLANWLESKFC